MASESKALVSAPIAVDSKQFSSPSADVTGHDDKRVRRPSIGFWRWAAFGLVDFAADTAYAQESGAANVRGDTDIDPAPRQADDNRLAENRFGDAGAKSDTLEPPARPSDAEPLFPITEDDGGGTPITTLRDAFQIPKGSGTLPPPTDEAGGAFPAGASERTGGSTSDPRAETATSHAFTVQASDGTNTATRPVTLTVTDVNDVTPSFTSGTTASAAENVSTATVLYTAAATDPDTVGTLTYSLTDDDGGRFEINASTGAVTLADGQALDYETATSHAFTVQASDGTNTATRPVTLTVTDVNEAPTDVSFANTFPTLTENSDVTGGVMVADILITDDALGTETLSLSGADSGSFEIRNGTELFFIDASPNYEVKSAYDVTVSADDASVGGTPDASRAFTLSITDVNEAPTAVSFANVQTIAENAVIGTGVKVADIAVVDDALGSETLSLSGADAASFEIRNGTELFFIDASPNYEVKSAYDVTVSADDASVGGTPDASQAFTLSITDVNEAPVTQNDTNGADSVIESGSLLFIGITPGDPNASGNVQTNDSDPDGDTMAVVGVAAGTPGAAPASGVGNVIVGTYGSLTVQSAGTWNYALNNNDPDTDGLSQGQMVNDTFTYAVSDPQGAISTAVLSIAIQGATDVL